MNLMKIRKRLYKKALRCWGAYAQIDMVIEECSELIQAFQKAKRGKNNLDNIFEEIADVEIMIEQMRCLYGNVEINEWKQVKLNKLYNLLLPYTGRDKKQ